MRKRASGGEEKKNRRTSGEEEKIKDEGDKGDLGGLRAWRVGPLDIL